MCRIRFQTQRDGKFCSPLTFSSNNVHYSEHISVRQKVQVFDIMDEITPNNLIANAIQRERNRRGLSLSALAAKAELAKSTLSQLESGNGNPNIETLWAIATALDVAFSSLFEVSQPDVSLVRAGEGDSLDSKHASYRTTLLANCPLGMRRDLYRVDLEPGTVRRSDPHPAGAIEHAILCAGQARLGPLGAEETLNVGDYYRYPADRKHSYEALLPSTQMMVVMEMTDR